MSATIGFYVELARRFLSQCKRYEAKYLLTTFMESNFGEQGMKLINDEEEKAKLEVSEKGNLIVNVNRQSEIKLICYLRERRRIIDLVNVLEKREILL